MAGLPQQEALKYVIYGAFAKVMLYGMSLYGLWNRIFALKEVPPSPPSPSRPRGAFHARGFGYKIASAFHFWCGCVSGAPPPSRLSPWPHAVGFAILIRFCMGMSGGALQAGRPLWNVDWPMIIAALSR
jgi:NADH:ubiquinone oxidoreductase subunit 2 (subunit N)